MDECARGGRNAADVNAFAAVAGDRLVVVGAENFDALTGEGLRDRAYTWTASAYLILAAAHTQRHEAIRSAAVAS